MSSRSGLPLAAEGLVEVGWARVVPSDLLLPGLAADDRARCGRLRRSGDRDRSATARVLLRAAVGAWVEMVADTEAARAGEPGRGPGARTRTWVRKEAVLKASGFGLATAPRKIVISAAHEAPRVIRPPHDDDATCWQLRDVELTTGYVCSVAVRTHAVGSIDVQVDEVDVRGLISGGSSGRNSHA